MRRPGVVRIVASDTPNIIRRFADYYCDGIQDEVEINTAINQLGTRGGIVELAAGTYRVSAPVVLKDWVTLRGAGRYSVLTGQTGYSGVFVRYGSYSGETGTVTGATGNTLTDGSKSWTTNQLANRWVVILRGTGAGQRRKIASNTATTLTLDANWDTIPSTDSVYLVSFTSIANVELADLRIAGAGTIIDRPVYNAGYDWIRLSAVSWTANEHVGKLVAIATGPGQGQVSIVLSNTSDTLYLEHPLRVLPEQGDRCFIGQGCIYMPEIAVRRVLISSCELYPRIAGAVVGTATQVAIDRTFIHGTWGAGIVLYPRMSDPLDDAVLWSSPSAVVDGCYYWVCEGPGVSVWVPRTMITNNRFQVNERPGIGVCVNFGKGHQIANNTFNAFDTESVAQTGTVTGATSTTLTDAGKNWSANAYLDMSVLITGGTGAGQIRRIVGNTSNTLTVSQAWTTTPDGTSQYSILNKGLAGVLIRQGGAVVTGNSFHLGGSYQAMARGVLNLGGSGVLVANNSVQRWDSYDCPLIEDVASTVTASNNIEQ